MDTDGLKTRNVQAELLMFGQNIAKYVNETLKEPKSTIPGSSSFATL